MILTIIFRFEIVFCQCVIITILNIKPQNMA